MQQDAYEFSDRENLTIGKTAKWARLLAIASFVMVLVHLGFAFEDPSRLEFSSLTLLVFDLGAGVVAALTYLTAGVLFLVVASALQRVVDTQGSDLMNMRKALDTLHRIFVLRIALVFLTIMAVVVVIAIGEGL
jgi:hypothetical protein